MTDSTEGSVHVDADPRDVMAVIADVARYPEWTRGITSVEVLSTTAGGRPGTARIRLDAPPVRDTYVVAYTWAERAVSWSLVEGDMLTAMEGAYEVEAAGDGTDVRFRLAVDVRVPILGVLKRKAAKAVVDTALVDLKARVEGSS